MPPNQRTSLKELFFLFLKLGTVAFGGPAAHIAMMKDEVVSRRQWLSETDFLDYLSAANLIPGPNSTELALHIGYSRRGWQGLLVAGISFILPAMLIVWALAWAYQTYGTLPQVGGILYGLKPVVIAIVAQALFGLGKSALKTTTLTIIGALAVIATFLGANELLVLLVAGILATVSRKRNMPAALLVFSFIFAVRAYADELKETVPVDLGKMFLIFVKIGSVLYGSGYVLLAFLQADFVDRLQWLSKNQLLDAIAVGQFTPGPVFTTATFVGYLIGSHTGAILATIGIFLPAFAFVAISAPLIPKIRRSPAARAFLDGVNVASLALMTFVTWLLGQSALIDPLTIGLFVIAMFLLIRYRVNSVWLLLAAGLIGMVS